MSQKEKQMTRAYDNHTITLDFELRQAVLEKTGSPESTEPKNPNQYTLYCNNDIWQGANEKAQYINMSLLVRTLWSMWLNDKVKLEGFSGLITIKGLTESLLTMYLNDEVVIEREDWVK